MGIRYGEQGLRGSRVFDFEIYDGTKLRLYSLLDYTKFTLILFSGEKRDLTTPEFVKVIQIYPNNHHANYWTNNSQYMNQAVLVRPDSFIESTASSEKAQALTDDLIKNLRL
jgi:hypothetical protein